MNQIPGAASHPRKERNGEVLMNIRRVRTGGTEAGERARIGTTKTYPTGIPGRTPRRPLRPCLGAQRRCVQPPGAVP